MAPAWRRWPRCGGGWPGLDRLRPRVLFHRGMDVATRAPGARSLGKRQVGLPGCELATNSWKGRGQPGVPSAHAKSCPLGRKLTESGVKFCAQPPQLQIYKAIFTLMRCMSWLLKLTQGTKHLVKKRFNKGITSVSLPYNRICFWFSLHAFSMDKIYPLNQH